MVVRLVRAELGPAADAVEDCKDSVVVKYVEVGEEGDWVAPCTGKLGFAAHLNWSSLPGVPDLHYPTRAEIREGAVQIEGLSILELVPGGSLGGDPTAEHLCNEEDAAAFGRIVGDLHAADTGWHDTLVADGKPGSVGFLLKKFENELAGDGAAAAEMIDLAKTRGYEPLCCFLLCRDLAVQPWFAPFKPLEAIVEATKLQDPASLMGRLVVGHGDLHNKQLLRREKGTHGDLAVIDYDRCSRMPAGADFAPSLAAGTVYPSLEMRRAAAEAYVAAVGPKVVESHTRTSIEDVLFDMEKASLLRWCFTMPTTFALMPPTMSDEHKGQYAVCQTNLIHEAVDLLKRAEDDEVLRLEILEKGVKTMTKSWSLIYSAVSAAGGSPQDTAPQLSTEEAIDAPAEE